MNTAEPITHTHAHTHTHTDKRAQLIPTTNARERTLLTTFTAWNNQKIGMTLGTRKKKHRGIARTINKISDLRCALCST